MTRYKAGQDQGFDQYAQTVEQADRHLIEPPLLAEQGNAFLRHRLQQRRYESHHQQGDAKQEHEAVGQDGRYQEMPGFSSGRDGRR